MFETCDDDGNGPLLFWCSFNKPINSLLRPNKDRISGIFKKKKYINNKNLSKTYTQMLFKL